MKIQLQDKFWLEILKLASLQFQTACETTSLLSNSPHASLKRFMHVLISPRLRNKKHKSYNDSDYENSHGSDALLYMTTLCATTCLTSVQGQTSIKITWSESIYIYPYIQRGLDPQGS